QRVTGHRGLLHEVRRVLVEDTVAQRQALQRLEYLGVGPMEPDLLRQRAGPPGGPQLLDVARLGCFGRKVGGGAEPFAATTAAAADGHGALPAPRAAIPPEYDDFVVREQVRQPVGLNVV